MNKTKITFVALLLCLISGGASAQLVVTDGFLMSNNLEVGIHNDGFEGSQTLPPFPTHYRGTSGRLGFISNPDGDWVDFNGDYFMPGAQENTFGIEVDGVTYRNSAQLGSDITSFGLSNYQTIGRCKFIDWDGTIAGIDIHMTYKMDTTDLFYTVQVVLTNTNPTDKNDVYFYKSCDPDNNQDIWWGFATDNLVVQQPTPDCPKAIVQATDNQEWDSYLGFAGLGENMRVAYGGFFVDDASAVWNGEAPYVGTPGVPNYGDQAIAICHKDNVIPAGESTSFEFVVVMDKDQIDQSLLNLLHFTWDDGPDFEASCTDTSIVTDIDGVEYEEDPELHIVETCSRKPVTMWVEAPEDVISEFNIEWLDEEGEICSVDGWYEYDPGSEAGVADFTCVVTFTGCFGEDLGGVIKHFRVITHQSPEVYALDNIFCSDSILMVDLNYIDSAEVDDPFIGFYENIPLSMTDPDAIPYTLPYMNANDTVYVYFEDPETGCADYDTVTVVQDSLTAGLDGALPDMCNEDGMVVDLDDFLSEDADAGGVWTINTVGYDGIVDPDEGTFNINELVEGSYDFWYTLDGADPCPADTAIFSIEVKEPSSAGDDALIELCAAAGLVTDLNELLVGNDPDGVWSEETDTEGAFDPVTGILNVESLSVGTYLFNYTSIENVPCESDVAVITVVIGAGPTAGFTFTPGSVYVDDTEVVFTNTSLDATTYEWNFGDGSPISTEENPTHNMLATPGLYEIQLTASNDLGCVDSLSAFLKVKEITLFYIPNSFTPDGDSFNDTFKPVFESGYDPYGFHMTIYNRYGEVVFESYDATAGWDGTYGQDGVVQSGIYTWALEFKELDTDRIQQHTGHLTILK